MARASRKAKKRRPDPQPASPLAAAMEQHLEALRSQNYSECTVKNRRVHIGFFLAWANEHGLSDPLDITRPILERYQRYLFHYRQKNGQPLSFRSQHSRLVPLRVWFRWMARQRLILHNPASELELPRLGHRLPKHVLTISEAEHVLAQPDVTNALGVRDRALMETLYSTGMRRLELASLTIFPLQTGPVKNKSDCRRTLQYENSSSRIRRNGGFVRMLNARMCHFGIAEPCLCELWV